MDAVHRKLQKAKIDLMRSPKFALWSGILMMGKTTIVDDCPTARTDGRNEEYGRDFIRNLGHKEVGFVVLHENLHKAFRHLTIWKKLYDVDARLANMACDYVINQILVDADPREETIAVPRKDGKSMALLDVRFRGMNSKQVFDILKQEQEEGGDEGGDEESEGGEGDGAGGSSKGQPARGKPAPQTGDVLDEHDWEGANNVSKEDSNALEGEIDRALRQGVAAQKQAGRGAGDMDKTVGDLLAPEVDWRELLREFMTNVCSNKDASSWRRVNRRFLAHDMYMPTLIGESVGGVVLGIDTSGSVGAREITQFLTEVKSIVEDVSPEVVDLMYWDSKVAAHETYDGASIHNIVSSTKPKGGGGTDPVALERYLIEKNIQPEVIVMLTDGYVDSWGSNWNAPIIWVVTDASKSRVATIGKTVFIKE